jgi:hypothetical protein
VASSLYRDILGGASRGDRVTSRSAMRTSPLQFAFE